MTFPLIKPCSYQLPVMDREDALSSNNNQTNHGAFVLSQHVITYSVHRWACVLVVIWVCRRVTTRQVIRVHAEALETIRTVFRIHYKYNHIR